MYFVPSHQSVLTWSRTGALAIKGAPRIFTPLLEQLTCNSAIQRIVAFTALR